MYKFTVIEGYLWIRDLEVVFFQLHLMFGYVAAGPIPMVGTLVFIEQLVLTKCFQYQRAETSPCGLAMFKAMTESEGCT